MFTRPGVLIVGAILALSPAFVSASDELTGLDGGTSHDATNLLERAGWSAADFFESPAHQHVCEAIESGSVDVVVAAIENGIDVNTPGKNEMTFLMWAYASDQFEVFKKLIVLGADPNKTMNVSIRSPLMHDRPKPGDCLTLVVFAEASEKWRTAVVDAGGNLNFTNSLDGHCVLFAAGSRDDEILDTLRQVIGANSVDLNVQDRFGRTAVMGAIMSGDYDCAVALIEAGASVDCYNTNHEQVIDMVARRWIGHRHLMEDDPQFKELWKDSRDRPAFERLVFLLSERGFDLMTAMLSVMRSDEMIDGLPYYEWRRSRRGHLNTNCPGVSNSVDVR